MNKVKEKPEQVVEELKNNGTVEAEDKAKDAIESLRVQLLEHQKQAEYHSTMATKAQGALEVLLQLYPQQEKEN
jgi:hypothetical protein|tara:strand:+ start:7314 stop:7535 length:222 start_codon:yes stop_codon:yes gene_type:complete